MTKYEIVDTGRRNTMSRKPLIAVSIISVVILILCSFQSVAGYQIIKHTSRLKMENLISKIKTKTTLQNKKNIHNFQLVTSSLVSTLKKKVITLHNYTKLELLLLCILCILVILALIPVYIAIGLLAYPLFLIPCIINHVDNPFLYALWASSIWLPVLIIFIIALTLPPFPFIIQNLKTYYHLYGES